MTDDLPFRLPRDGRTWRIGTTGEVAWIEDGTPPGLTITSAIPPMLEAYATVGVPPNDEDRSVHECAVLEALLTQSADQPWWLGYRDTGGDDVSCVQLGDDATPPGHLAI